ncbi:hypothetical protein pb186bvf_012467 [Paramecium bursaria]
MQSVQYSQNWTIFLYNESIEYYDNNTMALFQIK